MGYELFLALLEEIAAFHRFFGKEQKFGVQFYHCSFAI
jgi:hypothetical protein